VLGRQKNTLNRDWEAAEEEVVDRMSLAAAEAAAEEQQYRPKAEEEALQAAWSTLLAERSKLAKVVEAEASSPALEAEEARCLLLEVEELAEKLMKGVRELSDLGRLVSSVAMAVEQCLQVEQHVDKTKTYLGMECCALEEVVALVHERELVEAPEPFAQ
jgi:hypothetical protein